MANLLRLFLPILESDACSMIQILLLTFILITESLFRKYCLKSILILDEHICSALLLIYVILYPISVIDFIVKIYNCLLELSCRRSGHLLKGSLNFLLHESADNQNNKKDEINNEVKIFQMPLTSQK